MTTSGGHGGDPGERLLLGGTDPNAKGSRSLRSTGARVDQAGGVTASHVALLGVAFGLLVYLLTGGGARIVAARDGGHAGGDHEGDTAVLAAAVGDLAAQVRALAAEQRRGMADVRAQMQALREAGGAGGGSVAATTDAAAGRQPGVHVVVTSNGNRYMNWQTRVLYSSYKRAAAAPGSQLKGFTRVLHRTSDDELMTEVPTRRFRPLQPDCDVWCQYPVADRSHALLEWLETPDARRLEHLMIIETDYVFLAPPALGALPAPGHALSFPFGYIVPTMPAARRVVSRYYPGDPADVPQTGNAPVLMRFDDFARVCPKWVELTAKLEKDDEAKTAFGWVREMYAYSMAAALAKVKHSTPFPPESPLMVQPPADAALGKACIAHYTWGAVFHEGTATGKEVWRWDKREYAAGQYGDKCARLERIAPMPAWSDGTRLVLQDGVPVRRGTYDLLALLVEKFNEAVDEINRVNGGVPAGLGSWEEADRLARPSQESVDARAEVERKEREANAN